jgi:hypothetical protein
MNAAVAAGLRRNGVRARPGKSPFYTLLGSLMLVLAIAGFWPQYYHAAVGGTISEISRHPIIHVHSALFLGWVILFFAQAALIMRGKMQLHRRFGPALAIYGFAAAAIGLIAGFALAARRGYRVGDMDEGAIFVFAPTIDMVFLATFLAIAVRYRKKPEIHKRAMLVATFSIAVVGIGRLVGRFPAFDSPWAWQPLTLSPLLIALAYDLAVKRRTYAVLLGGIFVHWLRLNQEVYTETEAWLPIGRALIAPF